MSSAVLVAQSAAPDWPQFRGPNRDGVAPSFTEPKAWPEQLKRVWKVDVGDGYATPILVANRVYAFARQGDNEVMSALDASTGKVLWQTRYPAPVTINPAAKAHGPGPKSTPTFADGRLYTLGMGGSSPRSMRPAANNSGRSRRRQCSRCMERRCHRSSMAAWSSCTSAATIRARSRHSMPAPAPSSGHGTATDRRTRRRSLPTSTACVR